MKPVDRVEVRDFPGLILNMDPDDLPAGASRVQVNAGSHKPAELEVRPGYRVVRFEDQS